MVWRRDLILRSGPEVEAYNHKVQARNYGVATEEVGGMMGTYECEDVFSRGRWNGHLYFQIPRKKNRRSGHGDYVVGRPSVL